MAKFKTLRGVLEASREELQEIKVLDHVIIGDESYFSFADEGLIKEYNHNFLAVKRGTSVQAKI